VKKDEYIMSSVTVLKLFLFVVFLSLNLQWVIIFQGDGFSIKPYHIITLAAFPLFIFNTFIYMAPILVVAYASVVVIIYLLNLPNYGLNADFVNFIYCLYLFLLGQFFGQRLGYTNALGVFNKAAIFMIIVVIINIVIHNNVILDFMSNPSGHPHIASVYGGGVNLDSTWIAMLGVFVLSAKSRRIYYFFSFLISVLLASRIGLVLNLIALFYKVPLTNIRSIMSLTLIAVILMCSSILLGGDYIIQRIQDAGSDYSSFARFNMWVMSVDVFKEYPFGVGMGNAISSLEEFHDSNTHEGNLHNIFLQTLLEQGIIGFILFILIPLEIIRYEFKTRFNIPLAYFILMYYIAGLIQFRSVEVVFWFVFGCYFATRNEYSIRQKIETNRVRYHA